MFYFKTLQLHLEERKKTANTKKQFSLVSKSLYVILSHQLYTEYLHVKARSVTFFFTHNAPICKNKALYNQQVYTDSEVICERIPLMLQAANN